MKVLIKQAKILDPGSAFHQSIQDILIVDGTIDEINSSISAEADTTIEREDLHVSPGWIDVFANFCDPGYEYKETLVSGSGSRCSRWFHPRHGRVPNTKPAIDIKAQVEYILRKSTDLPVDIMPDRRDHQEGAEGKELAEMYDMQTSGAVSFSDGLKPVQSAGMMVKALQYVKRFNGVIIQMPDDESIGSTGADERRTHLHPHGPTRQADHFGRTDGEPRHFPGRLYWIAGYTSPASAQPKAIECHSSCPAKQKGVNISCSVTPYHLFFCDEDLQEYDSYLKVNPPLRKRADMLLLRQALLGWKD